MKGLSTEQNVHKSMNIVHDLATLLAHIELVLIGPRISVGDNCP